MNWLVFHLLEWCASTSAATMSVFALKENDEMSRGFFCVSNAVLVADKNEKRHFL
jgi:hypothetical protein